MDVSSHKRALPSERAELCQNNTQTPKRRMISTSRSFTRSPISTNLDGNSGSQSLGRSNTIEGVSNISDSQGILDSSPSPSTALSVLSHAHPGAPSINLDISPNRPELCYGAIIDARLAPLGRSSTISRILSSFTKAPVALQLRFRADAVTLLLPTLEECGVLDSKTAHILILLLKDHRSLEFEAYLDQEQTQGPYSGNKHSSVLPLSINVYGPRTSLENVATALSEARVFFQEPRNFHPASTYHNPHFLSWDDDLQTPRTLQLNHTPEIDLTAEICKILDQSPPETVVDWPLQDCRIRTTLHSHQLAALRFMVTREEEFVTDNTSSLWQRQCRFGKDVYVHKVTAIEQTTRPQQARGGLLADDMGTGKSLTLLALVIHTLDEARMESCRSPTIQQAHGWKKQNSGATLIIAPKSTLYNWKVEIEKHISPAIVKVFLYHGIGTSAGSNLLEKSDIVLTTYETACLDYFRGGVLRSIHWFRVVLDEAHQIRNRSTKTFLAIGALQAMRRWCLTGTPVQNRLEDLFSLTEFLRFYPVDNYSNVRRYILSPLGRKDKRVLTDLHSIMTTLALRRTKASCYRQRRSERVESIILSAKEREQYNLILQHVKKMRSRTAHDARSHILLRAIIKLRQICSNGTLSATSIFRNETPYTEETLSCHQCGDSLPSLPMQIEEPQDFQGAQLCHDCQLGSYYAAPDSSSLYSSFNGPLLQVHDSTNIKDSLRIEEIVCGSDSTGADKYQVKMPPTTYQTSSKLAKVLSNLIDLQQIRSEGEAPVKSLVFSCWTTTLTHLGFALASHNMPFVRFDGSQSLGDRASNISRFQSEPDLKIMLLSMGCGSVGLNLTAASYVHFVEPQWNPMVEAQAAARVDRLGQTKDVVIVRYVVENSIELRIQARQEKKLKGAKFSLSQMTQDRMADLPGDLMEIEELL